MWVGLPNRTVCVIIVWLTDRPPDSLSLSFFEGEGGHLVDLTYSRRRLVRPHTWMVEPNLNFFFLIVLWDLLVVETRKRKRHLAIFPPQFKTFPRCFKITNKNTTSQDYMSLALSLMNLFRITYSMKTSSERCDSLRSTKPEEKLSQTCARILVELTKNLNFEARAVLMLFF